MSRRVHRAATALLVGVVAASVVAGVPAPRSVPTGSPLALVQSQDDPADDLPPGIDVEPADTEVGRVPGAEWPTPPAVTATAYVLLDGATGQVLAERSADEARPVASTIKILTALSVLHRAEGDDVVEIGEEIQGVGGASVGLRPGDRWTVRQLLDALIVRSGNEAAVALAVHVGGSVEGFLELMARDAVALGLEAPVLGSVNGLEDTNRLTARQLGRITRAAMADERFRAVAAKRSVALPGRGTEASRNELLTTYPDATGVKTGYTEAAGWSLVASAGRDGLELIAVILDARSAEARFEDAAQLLDHGFEGFERVLAGVDLRLRRAGGWVDLAGPRAPLLLPVRDPELSYARVLPIEVPTDAIEVRATWHGEPMATIVAQPVEEQRPPVTGAAAVGRFLVDRAYAAMRATSRAEAWRG